MWCTCRGQVENVNIFHSHRKQKTTENRLRFFAHILRKPADRLFNVFDEFVELKLKKASAPIGSLLAKLPWLKRKFVTERQRANYKVVNVSPSF
ncbi:hypothetical protein RB195_004538 [Necator americanus]|uniref:Uncharacterized protein n=1 Tax=Necator americanus TaxID=51031 RepID=A0ABR1BIH0_NECAM